MSLEYEEETEPQMGDELDTFGIADLLLLEGHLDGVMYRCVPVIARPAFSLRMLRLACLPAVVQIQMVASVSVGVDPRCSVLFSCCVQNPYEQACFCSFTNSVPWLLMSGFPLLVWQPGTVSLLCRCIVFSSFSSCWSVSRCDFLLEEYYFW